MQGQNSALTLHSWNQGSTYTNTKSSAPTQNHSILQRCSQKHRHDMTDEVQRRQEYVIKMESVSLQRRKKDVWIWMIIRGQKATCYSILAAQQILLSLNSVFKSRYRRRQSSLTIWVKKGQKIVFSGVSGTATANINAKAFFLLRKGTWKWNTGRKWVWSESKNNEKTLCTWGRRWNSFGWQDRRPLHLWILFCLNGKSSGCERHINFEKFKLCWKNFGHEQVTFQTVLGGFDVFSKPATHVEQYNLPIRNCAYSSLLCCMNTNLPSYPRNRINSFFINLFESWCSLCSQSVAPFCISQKPQHLICVLSLTLKVCLIFNDTPQSNMCPFIFNIKGYFGRLRGIRDKLGIIAWSQDKNIAYN